MEYTILGYPPDGPTLKLDYREFAYAGKFVMSNTGKSVVTEDDKILGAIAFNADYNTATTGHLRYVTVRDSHKGQGIGTQLLRFTAAVLETDRFETILIAVNNPLAYRACYKAGFQFTGEETGIAELVLRYDPCGDRDKRTYQDGLAVFESRDIPPDQQSVLDRTDLPSIGDVPASETSET
ncbi:GNAT family N-acetyltransferase [Halovenus rubra]|uniref:GNAT family N-acetyltransferase n=2 Tax=Halovenus rubra TaxID=869890 RepID=A0ABD5X742_9EURY|nr:GNAT family N-acetyltransferase [Halovenus rubra]